MSGSTGSESGSGIGARLRTARERLGMTLLQVAEKLHVDAKVLESLEADRFAELGAPVYARGHIKRYAELVNENLGELLEAYAVATKPVAPDLTNIPKRSRVEQPGKLVVPSLVVLIGFVLIGVVWWVLQNLDVIGIGSKAKPQQVPATEQSYDEGSLTASDGGVDDAPAAAQSSQSVPHVDAPRVAEARSQPPAEAAAPAMRGPAQPVAAPAPHAGRGSLPQAPGTAEPPAALAAVDAEPVRAKPIEVTLKFASDSFAEVYDAKGKRLFSEIGSANGSRTLTGMPPLRVVLGNAAAVTLDVNGKAAKIPASTLKDDGARFFINGAGRITRAKPGSDGG